MFLEIKACQGAVTHGLRSTVVDPVLRTTVSPVPRQESELHLEAQSQYMLPQCPTLPNCHWFPRMPPATCPSARYIVKAAMHTTRAFWLQKHSYYPVLSLCSPAPSHPPFCPPLHPFADTNQLIYAYLFVFALSRHATTRAGSFLPGSPLYTQQMCTE